MHVAEAFNTEEGSCGLSRVGNCRKSSFDLCISQKATENVNNCLLQYQLTFNKNSLTILSHTCTIAFVVFFFLWHEIDNW